MPRYWARWYEPATDAWEKARDVLTPYAGAESAKLAVAVLREKGFELAWPFFTIPKGMLDLPYPRTGGYAAGEG